MMQVRSLTTKKPGPRRARGRCRVPSCASRFQVSFAAILLLQNINPRTALQAGGQHRRIRSNKIRAAGLHPAATKFQRCGAPALGLKQTRVTDRF